MKIRIRAFTLIELLVVVAIIALLIAVLIPSLGKAHDRAKIAVCASNLRQFNTAFSVYEQQYDGYMIPYRTQTGSVTKWTWCGSDVLGPTLSVLSNGTGQGNIDTMEKIKKMLMCPAVLHPYIDPNIANAIWDGSYTYNQNMGDCTSAAGVIPPTFQLDNAKPTGNPMIFRRKNNLPNQQLVMLDVRNNTNKNDLGFGNVDNLVNTSVTPNIVDNPDNTSSKGIAGAPHSGKRANMLFADGEIILGDPLLLANHNWIVVPDDPVVSGYADFPFH